MLCECAFVTIPIRGCCSLFILFNFFHSCVWLDLAWRIDWHGSGNEQKQIKIKKKTITFNAKAEFRFHPIEIFVDFFVDCSVGKQAEKK